MERRNEYGLLIGGEWVAAEGGKTSETRNPATGEVLARVAAASPADVDRAVKAARAAFEGWSKTSPAERSAILLRIADDLEKEADFFAKIETMDNGKPIRETSLVDVPLSVDHFRYFAGCLRAEEGSAAAQYLYGSLCEQKPDVVGEPCDADFWYQKAAAQGLEAAIEKLKTRAKK